MRLISKDDLIDLCHIMADKCDGIGESIWDQFATTVEWCVDIDAVEVVRCGECKWSDTFPPDSDADMPLKCLGIRYGGVYPEWYCEHGERKGEEDEARGV